MPDFTINIVKKVNENYSVKLTDDATIAPNPVVRIKINSPDIAVERSLDMYPSASIATRSPDISTEITSAIDYPLIQSYSGGTGDCFIYMSGDTKLYNTSTTLWMGKSADSAKGSFKTWIPFGITGIALDDPIQAATLTLVAADVSDNTSTPCKFTIACDGRTGALSLPSRTTLTSLPVTVASTTVNPAALWYKGVSYSYDVTAPVREVVHNSGWGGDAIAIVISNAGSITGKKRGAASYENTTYGQPILTIARGEEDDTPNNLTVANFRDSNKLAYWYSTGGSVNYNVTLKFPVGQTGSPTLYSVWEGFDSVNIPKDSVIQRATYNFVDTGTEADSGIKQKIGCEKAANPSMPTTWASADSRVMTTAYTEWETSAPGATGAVYSVDLTTAVQEIVSQATWASGNRLAVMFEDNGGAANVNGHMACYGNTTLQRPYLVVIYYTPGA